MRAPAGDRTPPGSATPWAGTPSTTSTATEQLPVLPRGGVPDQGSDAAMIVQFRFPQYAGAAKRCAGPQRPRRLPARHLWLRGSQWAYEPAGDGQDPGAQLRRTASCTRWARPPTCTIPTYDLATDITQASRSIVWLEPRHRDTYDRATSKTADRFKRYWLQLPTQPAIRQPGCVTTPKASNSL